MPKESRCAFCRPEAAAEALWEGERYRLLADAFPRCTGHVLLVPREHLPSQMSVPDAWLPEFHAARERVRDFLRETFGHAAFYENGGKRQQVPHAHLHGLPFEPEVPETWARLGAVRRVEDWGAVRQEWDRRGFYFFLEGEAGGWLIADESYKPVLRAVKEQVLRQTDARQDPETGKMARGGPEMVERTRALWEQWRRRAALLPHAAAAPVTHPGRGERQGEG